MLCKTYHVNPISTHASLAGRDPGGSQRFCPAHGHFNPRVPCGTRQALRLRKCAIGLFQPTRPLRDATQPADGLYPCFFYFNPRVPCGTRRLRWCRRGQHGHFNPRVPCGTRRGSSSASYLSQYISTHASLAGRDYPSNLNAGELPAISTHASLAGRDAGGKISGLCAADFNPRVPCGTRLHLVDLQCAQVEISTHASLAGRDAHYGVRWRCRAISTHASLAGRDTPMCRATSLTTNFNPRVPCGTRRA